MRLKRMDTVLLIIAVPLLLLFLLITIFRPAVSQPQANQPGSAPALPTDPPRADLISFGPLNGLGEAVVTGAPGSVLPDAHVLLVNLDSSHQAHVMSQPDGSFVTDIFAPPGSNIMIKHGPDHQFWHIDPWEDIELGSKGFLTVFPSTIIYRPHEHSAGANSLPFAAVGGIDINTESLTRTIGAAWSMTGTVGSIDDINPGDMITVAAKIRLYSQAITSTTNPASITLQMDGARPWLMLFDDQGNALPYYNQAGSNRLTPTGFPILDSNRPEVGSQVMWDPVNWQYKGGNIIEGDLTLTMTLEMNVPDGIYRPLLEFQFTGVPSGSEWRGGLLSWMAGLPPFTYGSSGAALPPLTVMTQTNSGGINQFGGQNPRLIWYLGLDNPSLGTRGAGALEDQGLFQPASFVTMQGAPYILPPLDPVTGNPAVYRLEPVLPMIAYGRGADPAPPLLPFALPGGQLCVTVHEPDGQEVNLGCQAFAQSRSGDKSTSGGELLNYGAIEVSEYYGLTAANDQFAVTFTKTGYHVIEMSGWIEDVWGNRYDGGGTYEVWVANPIDLDPGLLPGTPLAVGDAVNPTVQLNPRLPAYVNLIVRHWPDSDPNQLQTYVIEGYANRFGYFTPDDPPIFLGAPGEYRLDLFAAFQDPETGEMYAAAATWGSVVMSPPAQTPLVAHGRRGSDNFTGIPNQWFVFCDPNLQPPLLEGSTPHLFNPYLNGDILWSYDAFLNDTFECTGDALMMNASLQDTVGTVEAAITTRYNRAPFPLSPPGSFSERVLVDSLPLFSSTSSGRTVSLFPSETDQIAYAYLSSQRPGVRVRESVAEERQGSGYWRLDSMYDGQPGVGIQGDLPNDFKFQFVGIVYRDLVTSANTYLGQATGWVHLPYSDTTASRAMPPFSGPGNGGWPTTGGPLLTLQGEQIHMFILPTGVRPGAILQVGDRFNFGGQLMPTLDSQVAVTVTAPSGQPHLVSGQANSIGYFYNPAASFEVDEPGRWTVTVQVWHDGQIGSGEQVNCDPGNPFDPLLPCPSGDVLGSVNGTYAFYVVPYGSPRLTITTPSPGPITFGDTVQPINISGPVPAGVTNVTVDYTIGMPGFILEEGQAQLANGDFFLTFDPVALNNDFPNLDLIGRYTMDAGLADTLSIGLLLTGQQGGQEVHYATTLTIQGDLVYVENAADVPLPPVYLPIAIKSN